MRLSRYFLTTLKETPSDAEIVSHQLMLRAGMIRKLAAGLYTWLPLGLRVLRKVESIVREEMDKAGALELLMPAVQPAHLWIETDRWDKFGPQLLKIIDRHENAFCFGPTHEEVITDLIRQEIRSYKQLPLNLYQIQNKFRDEIRPRFGVMRAREFLMKDAYSFHVDSDSLNETYQAMYQAYSRIFTRLGLAFRAVQADTGSIGGSASHEFHVLAQSGEDLIAYNASGSFAANVELAPALPDSKPRPKPSKDLGKVATPTQKTIAEICEFLQVKPEQTVKTLLVKGKQHPVVALLLRGDYELNPVKAEKHPLIAAPLTFAKVEEIKSLLNCDAGFIGPVHLPCPIIADHSVLAIADFVCGANQDGMHLCNVNWERDLPLPEAADLRKVVAGDASPDGQGSLEITRGIEVGHIFQLGTRYSAAMGATITDEAGKEKIIHMGCYGIGVSRIVAAAIEQNYDDKGIIWPARIAPFEIALLPMNMHKSPELRQAVEHLYQQMLTAGFEVLLDDRPERPGVMFADCELLGIPHRLVLGEKGLANNSIEYKGRRDSESQEIPLSDIITWLNAHLLNSP